MLAATPTSAHFGAWPMPPGTLYGCLLNHRSNLDALQASVAGELAASVYQALPKAPVLYIKPANCFAADGSDVLLDADVSELECGATLGLVIGRRASRLGAAEALSCLAGYVLLLDLSVPHASLHRPAVRQRCRDGYAPMGTRLLSQAPEKLLLSINGEARQTIRFDALCRDATQLLVDVTAFMSLSPGDILHLGVPADPPLAREGDRISLSGGGESLSVRLVQEDELA